MRPSPNSVPDFGLLTGYCHRLEQDSQTWGGQAGVGVGWNVRALLSFGPQFPVGPTLLHSIFPPRGLRPGLRAYGASAHKRRMCVRTHRCLCTPLPSAHPQDERGDTLASSLSDAQETVSWCCWWPPSGLNLHLWFVLFVTNRCIYQRAHSNMLWHRKLIPALAAAKLKAWPFHFWGGMS